MSSHDQRRERWLEEYINQKFDFPARQWNETAKSSIREGFNFNWWCLKRSLRDLRRSIWTAIRHQLGLK